MAYSNRKDIENAIGRETVLLLTDDGGSNATDNVILDDAILAADTIINGYLQPRYALPIAATPDATPPLIRRASTNLTVCELYARRSPEKLSDAILKRQSMWLKQLELLANGTTELEGITEATADGDTIRTNQRSPVFTSTVLDQY